MQFLVGTTFNLEQSDLPLLVDKDHGGNTTHLVLVVDLFIRIVMGWQRVSGLLQKLDYDLRGLVIHAEYDEPFVVEFPIVKHWCEERLRQPDSGK